MGYKGYGNSPSGGNWTEYLLFNVVATCIYPKQIPKQRSRPNKRLQAKCILQSASQNIYVRKTIIYVLPRARFNIKPKHSLCRARSILEYFMNTMREPQRKNLSTTGEVIEGCSPSIFEHVVYLIIVL